MYLFILSIFTLFSLGICAESKTVFFPGKDLEDFNYATFGVAPYLPAYQHTKDVSWLILPEASVGQRHFISQRNAIDCGLSLKMNFNLEQAAAHASYLFYPMPKYGFYLGAGVSVNEVFMFINVTEKFFYWTDYHGIAGLQFKLNDETPVFVHCKYSSDGTLSVLYGFSF